VKYQEVCQPAKGTASAYTNLYWLSPQTNVIWKSHQWVGPVAGYLGLEMLISEKS